MARVMPKLHVRAAQHALESPVAWQREAQTILRLLVAAEAYATILGDPTAPIVKESTRIAGQLHTLADDRAVERVCETLGIARPF